MNSIVLITVSVGQWHFTKLIRFIFIIIIRPKIYFHIKFWISNCSDLSVIAVKESCKQRFQSCSVLTLLIAIHNFIVMHCIGAVVFRLLIAGCWTYEVRVSCSGMNFFPSLMKISGGSADICRKHAYSFLPLATNKWINYALINAFSLWNMT